MDVPPPFAVFTDLDGTLLDHDTYDWTPAKPALRLLAYLGVPVVLASSKTTAEIAPLQREMGLTDWPAIVENGAGVLGSGSTVGRGEYTRLRAAMDSIDADLRARFRGFGDMSADEVAGLTNLTVEQATLAKDRRFSEPGIWGGTPEAERAFIAALVARGLSARRGGRFLTLSYGANKADRMRELRADLGNPPCMALGDAPNDAEMLEAADVPIIIPNPHGPYPELSQAAMSRLRQAPAPGPVGWNVAITTLVHSGFGQSIRAEHG